MVRVNRGGKGGVVCGGGRSPVDLLSTTVTFQLLRFRGVTWFRASSPCGRFFFRPSFLRRYTSGETFNTTIYCITPIRKTKITRYRNILTPLQLMSTYYKTRIIHPISLVTTVCKMVTSI